MLNDTEKAAASAEGWMLVEVVDKHTVRWKLLACPSGPFRNADDAQRHVVEMARSRSPFHLHVLRKVVLANSKEFSQP
jgi:hypothetical protein